MYPIKHGGGKEHPFAAVILPVKNRHAVNNNANVDFN